MARLLGSAEPPRDLDELLGLTRAECDLEADARGDHNDQAASADNPFQTLHMRREREKRLLSDWLKGTSALWFCLS